MAVAKKNFCFALVLFVAASSALDDPRNEKAGKLLLGATERSYAKTNLTFLSVVDKNFWTLRMDRIVIHDNIKSSVYCVRGCNVILDTSTNGISGPKDDIQRINNILGATMMSPTWPYRYVVDCREFAKLPHVHFVLGGKEFTIESKYYIQRMKYVGFPMCVSPFIAGDDNLWTLGGAFLMQFYTEFDVGNGTVGIAERVF